MGAQKFKGVSFGMIINDANKKQKVYCRKEQEVSPIDFIDHEISQPVKGLNSPFC